ncbi:MAG: hypothetical protein LBI10_02105 [Deltaproteobacteria bacterium]|jgi:mannose-6-phosphate isomerase class I|nr:hypothetical protein [Deltaproteobacteria bacterium]
MLGDIKNDIYPLPLTPILAEKPWGQKQASPFFSEPIEANWGEVFLAIRDFGLTSRVANGPLADKPIHQIGQTWGRELIDPPGSANWPLPLTVWLERTGDKPGPIRVKSGPEFWRVLWAEPDSWIGAGENPDFAAWPQRLRRIVVDADDTFIVPGGLAQAQGPGLTIFKVSLSKINVETLYDWERPPDVWDYQSGGQPIPRDGEPLIVLRPPLSSEGLNLLAQLPSFEASLLEGAFQSFNGGRFAILCPIKGRGRLNSSGAFSSQRLTPGKAILIPAGLGPYSIVSPNALTAVILTIPKNG